VKPDEPLTTTPLRPDSAGPPGGKPNGAGTPPRLSKKRLAAAFAIAAASDAVGAFFTLAPPVAWVVDIVTAALLFAVLGWQWLLLPGLVLEAIPGLAVFPFWLLVVAAIAGWGTVRPKPGRFRKGEQ
jgi:hypothetical protein